MLGNDYNSLDEFVYACRNNRVELDTSRVLGKIYSVKELRRFAEVLEVDLSEVAGSGLNIRYSTADVIAENTSGEDIGEQISLFDHDLLFPVLTYYQIPDVDVYSKYETFVLALRTKGVQLTNGFWQKYNGITEPPPHNCTLESVKTDEGDEIVSLLFSCTRALVNPSEAMLDFSSLFLSRVPVLARVFFKLGIIEFSIPCYAEPIAAHFNYEIQAPKRYQQAFQTAYKALRDLVPHSLASIRYKDLPLWFEQKYHAKDMGWKIAPLDHADFDLTQNLIPLKDIIDGFITTLNRECSRSGRTHKLQDVDLYHVFRTLQSESHTHTMVQNVPFGQRGGGVTLSVYYGAQDAEYYPVVLLSSAPTEVSLENLREAVSTLRSADMDNPYAINSLFIDES